MLYDAIIIGAGPAGFTAGIYASRREMKSLILAKNIGGQVIWASEIENYPGFKTIANTELIAKMQDQVANLGVELKNEEVRVVSVKNDKTFEVITDTGKYNGKTLILAIGLAPRRLAIPGEEEFTGRGVSYCANCDGPFYRGKDVVVVGGGNAALDAAEIMSKIAKKVYLVHRRDEFRGFENLVDEVMARENVEMILNSEIKKIIGATKVEKIKVINNQTQEEKEIKTDGVFIEIGRVAHTDMVKDLVKRDERDQILVDENCRTSQPGIFACGDVTQVPFKQITIACGQATIAALSAYQYLQTKDGGETKPIFDRSIKN